MERGLFNSITPWSKRGRALAPRAGFVPRIDDRFTDIAIYLYQTQEHAEAGSEIGGSGFLVGIPVDGKPDRVWTLAVTNRHVIEQGASCVRVNNKAGFTSVFDIPERDWIFHAEDQDLAVARVGVNEDYHRVRFIALDSLLTREKISELDVGLGTDTFIVGRFIGRDGGQTNVPTVRFGHVAQMPTKIKNAFGREQESFLIETRSIGGYSGSPVFGYRLPFQMKQGEAGSLDITHWGPALIGVDWGHSGQAECVFDAGGRELDMYVESNTGLTLAIPSWRLLELINSKAVRDKLSGTQPGVGDVDLAAPPELRLWDR